MWKGIVGGVLGVLVIVVLIVLLFGRGCGGKSGEASKSEPLVFPEKDPVAVRQMEKVAGEMVTATRGILTTMRIPNVGAPEIEMSLMQASMGLTGTRSLADRYGLNELVKMADGAMAIVADMEAGGVGGDLGPLLEKAKNARGKHEEAIRKYDAAKIAFDAAPDAQKAAKQDALNIAKSELDEAKLVHNSVAGELLRAQAPWDALKARCIAFYKEILVLEKDGVRGDMRADVKRAALAFMRMTLTLICYVTSHDQEREAYNRRELFLYLGTALMETCALRDGFQELAKK